MGKTVGMCGTSQFWQVCGSSKAKSRMPPGFKQHKERQCIVTYQIRVVFVLLRSNIFFMVHMRRSA
jgi:hypothetical protein